MFFVSHVGGACGSVDLQICDGKTYRESKQQTKIIRHQTKFRSSVV